MLVLLDSRVPSVVANQVLQRPEPLLAVAGRIVLAILASDLVVEHSELLVQKREDIASWITLTRPHEVGAWLGHGMQSHARNVPFNIAMVPPE